jgi:hypothetical protein
MRTSRKKEQKIALKIYSGFQSSQDKLETETRPLRTAEGGSVLYETAEYQENT